MEKIKPAKTLTQQAYKVIKQAIITNNIEPGEELAEEHIANKLGISRTPIRAALTQLAAEGLVEMKAGRKAKVSSISAKEVFDFQAIRECLEPLAANLASQNIDKEQIEILKDICKRQKNAIQENDLSHFIELDHLFHITIADFSSNYKLKEFINNLHTQIQRFFVLTNVRGALESFKEHLIIVQTLEKKDALEATNQMRAHIQGVTRRFNLGV